MGPQECLFRGRREVTDFENGIEMLNRHWYRVRRIRDLTHEAAVLAHGVRLTVA
jgi:hypothetical protein